MKFSGLRNKRHIWVFISLGRFVLCIYQYRLQKSIRCGAVHARFFAGATQKTHQWGKKYKKYTRRCVSPSRRQHSARFEEKRNNMYLFFLSTNCKRKTTATKSSSGIKKKLNENSRKTTTRSLISLEKLLRLSPCSMMAQKYTYSREYFSRNLRGVSISSRSTIEMKLEWLNTGRTNRNWTKRKQS